MTAPLTFAFDTPGDAQRAAELRRVKALATLVLAATLALFATAKALLHVHPDDPAPLAHFATRLLLPGALMSVAFLAVEPSFIVTAHCTAHVLIPFLFS